MSELLRVVIVVAGVVAALAMAGLSRRWAGRRGIPIEVAGLLEGPGVVIFTKDDCATCVEMLDRLGTVDLPIRQVRAEEEPDELAHRSVTAVPVTVFQDGAGRPRAQFRGLASLGALRRASRQAR